MNRALAQSLVIALIALFGGVALAAAGFAALPDPGSAPAIFDDFAWSSTSNGFWHVNAIGAQAITKNSLLTLSGHSIELDRRIQTDPYQTVIVAKLRGIHFNRFGLGIGVYHAGTVGLEFDDDGVKCGRGTDHGYQIDFLKNWTTPPPKTWFYVEVTVGNPYPNFSPEQLAKLNPDKLKALELRCSLYDSSGRLIATDVAANPKPNGHYVSLDEVYLRTWDSGNDYQLDWFYAGPPSGNPARSFMQATSHAK